MEKIFPLTGKGVYSVFIGGVEVNDYFLTYREAMNLAFDYYDDNWAKAAIEVFDCTNGYENATLVELDF
jgi:hypothetical protein